jgi:hypothetical protein
MQQVSRGLRRDSELAGWLDSLDDLHKIAFALTEADYYRKVTQCSRIDLREIQGLHQQPIALIQLGLFPKSRISIGKRRSILK